MANDVYIKIDANRPISFGNAITHPFKPIAESGSLASVGYTKLDIVEEFDKLDYRFVESLNFIASSGDVSDPNAAGTAASVVYSAVPNRRHVISSIHWSYSVTPTTGNIKVLDGSSVVFDTDITSAGAGFHPFDPPKQGSPGQSMTVILASGAGSSIGTLSVGGHAII